MRLVPLIPAGCLWLTLLLGGCGLVQVAPPIGTTLRADPQGQPLAQMLGSAVTRLDHLGQASTVFIPERVPAATWTCWREHPAAAQQEAQRYVLALTWAPNLRSPASLQVASEAGDRRTLAVPLVGPASVDGVAVTGVIHGVNGTLIRLAGPLPDAVATPCTQAEGPTDRQ